MSTKSSPTVLPFDLWSAWDAWVRNLLAENRMPLSGDVKQWIKAWGEVVGQVGLFNVNIVNSSDPATERAIVAKHSYGRQLGRILDVLEPLVRANPTLINEGERKKFEQMVADIRCVAPRKCLSLEQVVDLVRHLSDQPPERYSDDLDRLIKRLEELKTAIDAETQ
jgi:hypothetical protein